MQVLEKIQKETQLARGQIWYARLNGEGSVQNGVRPVIVCSNERANLYSPTITVITCTSQDKKHLPTHVYLYPNNKNNLTSRTIAMAETITTINKQTMLLSYIGEVGEEEMIKIDKAVAIQLQMTYKTDVETAKREMLIEQRINKMVNSIYSVENYLLGVHDMDLMNSLKLQKDLLLDYCESNNKEVSKYYQSILNNRGVRRYA